MNLETRAHDAATSLHDATTVDVDAALQRLHRTHQRRTSGRVIAAAAVLVGTVLWVTGLADDRRAAPVEQPKPIVGATPVWYDANGLHRGDIVEKTPVSLLQPERPGPEPDWVIPQKGALALVRSGAVFLDPAAGDVWFHPWGGTPRVVGHDSKAGPGGDPNGDTAVWFEGSDPLNATPGELVVYDTAAGREISRIPQNHGVADCSGICGDHFPAGNGFLQVSTERVVWTSGPQMYSHDLRTGSTSEVKPPEARYLADVHDDIEVLAERDSSDVVLTVPGRAEQRYPELETHLRLSPSGNHVLAIEETEDRHAAAIVDTRSGELWRVPNNAYAWIAWSYGDIALLDTETGLLACDASRRTCEQLPAERPFLMPTN